MDVIYVDHAATTPLSEDVLDYMLVNQKACFANPSSVHSSGREARKYLREARANIAQLIGANENEIIFTSGGTEANNLAILGIVRKHKANGNHVITTKQEHQATLKAMKQLEKEGFHVTYVNVNEDGILNVDEVKQAITDETILFSTSYVNNETGIIQPIEELSELLQEQNVYFHVDAVQAMGLFPINLSTIKIDALSASSHKINGPNGIGFLYVQEDVSLEPILVGGSQEQMRRAGTENVLGVLGFKKALELADKSQKANYLKYKAFKETFLTKLTEAEVSFQVNGNIEEMSPHIVNISFTDIPVETMLTNLDLEKINASAGSACTAGTLEPSHVLQAMYGKEDPRIKEAIRFSFGSLNDKESIDLLAWRIIQITNRLQK